MRQRSEIEKDVQMAQVLLESDTLKGNIVLAAILSVQLDIRDLLSERHTRREKVKVCGDCGGSGKRTEYVETADGKGVAPYKVPCECQVINTN